MRRLSFVSLIALALLTSLSFAAEKKPKEATKTTKTKDEVFFTPTGKKFHSSEKCFALQRSKKIKSSTKEAAEDEGLTACATCFNSKGEAVLPQEAKPVNPGEVFVTPSGKKYHSMSDCKFLARSTKVKKVTQADAEDDSLEPCKACCAPADKKETRSEKSGKSKK